MATNQLTLFNSSQVWEAREQMDAAGDTWDTTMAKVRRWAVGMLWAFNAPCWQLIGSHSKKMAHWNMMGWTKNRGIYPPKWMVKIMEHPIKMDDLDWFGATTQTIFGNTHILLTRKFSDKFQALGPGCFFDSYISPLKGGVTILSFVNCCLVTGHDPGDQRIGRVCVASQLLRS